MKCGRVNDKYRVIKKAHIKRLVACNYSASYCFITSNFLNFTTDFLTYCIGYEILLHLDSSVSLLD